MSLLDQIKQRDAERGKQEQKGVEEQKETKEQTIEREYTKKVKEIEKEADEEILSIQTVINKAAKFLEQVQQNLNSQVVRELEKLLEVQAQSQAQAKAQANIGRVARAAAKLQKGGEQKVVRTEEEKKEQIQKIDTLNSQIRVTLTPDDVSFINATMENNLMRSIDKVTTTYEGYHNVKSLENTLENMLTKMNNLIVKKNEKKKQTIQKEKTNKKSKLANLQKQKQKSKQPKETGLSGAMNALRDRVGSSDTEPSDTESSSASDIEGGQLYWGRSLQFW